MDLHYARSDKKQKRKYDEWIRIGICYSGKIAQLVGCVATLNRKVLWISNRKISSSRFDSQPGNASMCP